MKGNIFIIGGCGGIGGALASRYMKDGCRVVVFDVDSKNIRGFLEENDESRGFEYYQIDVRSEASTGHAFMQAIKYGFPDVVINCAGITLARSFEETTEDEYRHVIDVNMIGSRNVAAVAVKNLNPGGHLVLLSSMAGLVSCYGYSAYGSSKRAVIGLAGVMRIELKSKGIDISVVCPPEVETQMVIEERKNRPVETEVMKLMAGSLSLDYATDIIYKGIIDRKYLIMPGVESKLLYFLLRFLPGSVSRMFEDLIISSVRSRR